MANEGKNINDSTLQKLTDFTDTLNRLYASNDSSTTNAYIIIKELIDHILSLVPGGGDMLKSIYDTDNSGVVDDSELINGNTVANDSAVLANTAKVTNVSTNLSLGTVTAATMIVISSDGINVTLIAANTTDAGLLTASKWNEIVANNAKISYTDAGDVSSNTAARHSHANKTLLDTITDTGGGTNFLADDGTYKAVAGSSPLTTKGDVYTYSTVDARLGVGTNGQFLTADSSEVTGLKWSTPAGGGDMVLADPQTVTGAKTFEDTKLLLRNVANTFNGSFVNTNTVDRIYTLQDAAGTLAFISDITVTDLSLGTITGTTMIVVSSDGNDVTLIAATTDDAGLLTAAKFDEIVINNAKVTNVSTNLSFTRDATTVTVESSDGNNAILPEADTTNAGILGSGKWDEIVANTLKVTNVTTNLSLGTITGTTVIVVSSDGTNVTLIAANATDAGLLTAAKFNEIVANNAKVSYDDSGNVVLLTGNQTVAGEKTFSNNLKVNAQAHGGDSLHIFSASKTFDANDGNIQEMPVSASTTIAVSNLQVGTFILHLPVTVGTSPTITIGASLGTKYTTSADLVNANGDENTITIIKYPSGSVRYTISNIVA